MTSIKLQSTVSNATVCRNSQQGQGRRAVKSPGIAVQQMFKQRLSSRPGTLQLAHGKPTVSSIRSTVDVSCRATGGAKDKARDKNAKVKVTLGPYKDGALQIDMPAVVIEAADVDAALAAKKAKKYNLKRVNFTGSGARLGLTVKIDFEGKYVDGPDAGKSIPGTKASMFELELKEGRDAPWCDFVTAISNAGVSGGMGQEESKTFQTRFPETYGAAPLRGVAARFTVTVKEISQKEMIPEDTRPEDVQRAELEQQLAEAAERKRNIAVDAELRRQLEATCTADTDKVAASVSWAKFGPKSLAEFQWNLITEEIAREEGLEFDQVMPFLRAQATNVAVGSEATASADDDDGDDADLFT